MKRHPGPAGMCLAAVLAVGACVPGPAPRQETLTFSLETGAGEGAAALRLFNLTGEPAVFDQRPALRLAFSPDYQARVLSGENSIRTALAIAPVEMSDGVIDVELAAAPNTRGGPDSRGFAGLAFRVSADAGRYDAIYLRMTNGALATPPPPSPRDRRAIQYVSHPDWPFERFREESPGAFEAGAAIAPDRWVRLRIEIEGAQAKAFLDDVLALEVDGLKTGQTGRGAVALFVDTGTTAYFRNLRILPRS